MKDPLESMLELLTLPSFQTAKKSRIPGSLKKIKKPYLKLRIDFPKRIREQKFGENEEKSLQKSTSVSETAVEIFAIKNLEKS